MDFNMDFFSNPGPGNPYRPHLGILDPCRRAHFGTCDYAWMFMFIYLTIIRAAESTAHGKIYES